MKKIVLIFIVFTSFLYSKNLGLSVGKDFNENFVYDLSLKNQYDFNLLNSSKTFTRFSSIYLDNEHLNILAIEPLILSYNIFDKTDLEFSIGLTYFSKKNISNKNFGMNFQFRDSISIVYDFSEKVDFEVNYSHYSNGSLKEENDGINILSFKLLYELY